VLSMGLRPSEEASYSTAAIPSSIPFSLAGWDMSLESQSCMSPLTCGQAEYLFAAEHAILFQDPCHEIQTRFSVKQRMHPYHYVQSKHDIVPLRVLHNEPQLELAW